MVRHESEIEGVVLSSPQFAGIFKKILVGPLDGYDGYMRLFSVPPGNRTPAHSHSWWHLNYVLEGEGELYIDGAATQIRSGSVAFVDGGKPHQFVNVGSGELKFICIVPKEGDNY